jgi:hypothetical protein
MLFTTEITERTKWFLAHDAPNQQLEGQYPLYYPLLRVLPPFRHCGIFRRQSKSPVWAAAQEPPRPRSAVSTRIGSLNNLPVMICPGPEIMVILTFCEGPPRSSPQIVQRVLFKMLPQSVEGNRQFCGRILRIPLDRRSQPFQRLKDKLGLHLRCIQDGGQPVERIAANPHTPSWADGRIPLRAGAKDHRD